MTERGLIRARLDRLFAERLQLFADLRRALSSRRGYGNTGLATRVHRRIDEVSAEIGRLKGRLERLNGEAA